MGIVTDDRGRARSDRVKASHVVVVLPTAAAGTWRIEDDGRAPERSEREARIHWHTMVSGECLSKIPARRGLKSYEVIWDHPKNAAPLAER